MRHVLIIRQTGYGFVDSRCWQWVLEWLSLDSTRRLIVYGKTVTDVSSIKCYLCSRSGPSMTDHYPVDNDNVDMYSYLMSRQGCVKLTVPIECRLIDVCP